MPQQKESKETKSPETEATRTIKAAAGLQKEAPVHFPSGEDFDFVSTMKNQIAYDEAERAANIAKSGKIESEMKIKDLEKQRAAPSQSGGVPVGGLLGGFGQGGRAAIIQSILSSLPEAERANFVKENKDLILSDASPQALLAAMGKTQGGGHQSGMMEVAALITALGEEQRQNMLLSQRLNPPREQPQQIQPSGAVTQIDLLTLLRDQNNQSIAMVKGMNDQFIGAIKVMQEQVKAVQDESRISTLNLQKEVLSAKEASFQKDQDRLLDKIEDLTKHANTTPEDVLTLKHMPLIRQALGEIGMNVSSRNAMSEENSRKWDLEDRKLDIMTAREQREHEARMIAMQRQTALLGGLKEIVRGAGIDDVRVGKVLKEGGSEKARAAAERF